MAYYAFDLGIMHTLEYHFNRFFSYYPCSYGFFARCSLCHVRLWELAIFSSPFFSFLPWKYESISFTRMLFTNCDYFFCRDVKFWWDFKSCAPGLYSDWNIHLYFSFLNVSICEFLIFSFTKASFLKTKLILPLIVSWLKH